MRLHITNDSTKLLLELSRTLAVLDSLAHLRSSWSSDEITEDSLTHGHGLCACIDRVVNKFSYVDFPGFTEIIDHIN